MTGEFGRQESKMAATMVETPPPQLITNIEWEMMDKSKFFPLYTLSSFTGNVNFFLFLFCTQTFVDNVTNRMEDLKKCICFM